MGCTEDIAKIPGTNPTRVLCMRASLQLTWQATGLQAGQNLAFFLVFLALFDRVFLLLFLLLFGGFGGFVLLFGWLF